jgi:hypothetical protein
LGTVAVSATRSQEVPAQHISFIDQVLQLGLIRVWASLASGAVDGGGPDGPRQILTICEALSLQGVLS